MKKVIANTSVVLATLLTIVFMAPTAAQADDGRFTMYTDDANPGGRVVFHADGDYVQVCDIEADGSSVWLRITDLDGSGGYSMNVAGNDECKVHRASDGGSYDLEEYSCFEFNIYLSRETAFGDLARWFNSSTGGNC